jgi:hypothetical protein
MIVLVRTVIQETIPTIQSYIDDIKSNW